MKRRKGIEEAAHMPFFFFFLSSGPTHLRLLYPSQRYHLPNIFQNFLFSPSRAKSVILFFLSLLCRPDFLPFPSACSSSSVRLLSFGIARSGQLHQLHPPSFPTPVPAPPSLHGEHQEAGEGGVFPSSHEISSLQFKVRPVSLLHLDQNAVAGRLARHILVAGKGRNHRPAIVHQAYLEQTEKGGQCNGKRFFFWFVFLYRMDTIRLQTTPFCLFVCWFVFLTPLLTWKIRTLTKYQETREKKFLSAASCTRDVIYADKNKGKSPFHLHLIEE